MRTIKARTTVQVSTGDIWRTTWRVVPDDGTVEETLDFLKRLSEMSKFELESDKGYTVYFNPEHIVSLYVETKGV